MAQKIAGTFAGSAATNTAGQISAVLVIPSGTTSLVFNASGDIDANNMLRVRRSTDNGLTWTNAYTAASVTVNQAVTVAIATQTHFMVESFTSQSGKTINYSLSAES